MDGGQFLATPIDVAAPSASAPRRAPSRWGGVAVGAVAPLLLLAAWQATAQFDLLPEQILPAPQAVYEALRDGVADGSLLSSTLVSLRRVAEGFVAGASLGVLLGVAIGLSPVLRRMLQPSFLALSQVPVFGWLPILVLLVGIDDAPKIMIIGWSAFIPVVLNTAQGIRDVPPGLLELGRVLSFSRWAIFTEIVLPSAVPPLFTGLREGLANSWQSLVAVELIASFEGLGYMMAYGRQLFQLELVMAAAIVIGLIGLLLHLSLSAIERHLQRWRTDAVR